MAPVPVGGWLDHDQQRAWLAYIRVQLRLAYEMNRQLLADSGMSLPPPGRHLRVTPHGGPGSYRSRRAGPTGPGCGRMTQEGKDDG